MHNEEKRCGFWQASLGAGARSLKEKAAQNIRAKNDREEGVRDTNSLGAAVLRKHTTAWKHLLFYLTRAANSVKVIEIGRRITSSGCHALWHGGPIAMLARSMSLAEGSGSDTILVGRHSTISSIPPPAPWLLIVSHLCLCGHKSELQLRAVAQSSWDTLLAHGMLWASQWQPCT